jgi:hypothetical protein
VDLTWDSKETWQQGLIDGGTRLMDKKKQDFNFGALLCGIELLGAAWESCTHVLALNK